MSKRGLVGLFSVWAAIAIIAVCGVLYPMVTIIGMFCIIITLVFGILSHLIYKMFE